MPNLELISVGNGTTRNGAAGSSDIPVTETQTDTEMIDISKTHTETSLILKRFSILILYTNDRLKTN